MSEGKKKQKKKEAKCPKCDSDLHFVEKVGQHYCFSCEDYFTLTDTMKPELENIEGDKVQDAQPVSETPEKKVESLVEPPACPACGEPTQPMKDTDQYYCYSCEKYADEAVKKEERPAKDEEVKAEVATESKEKTVPEEPAPEEIREEKVTEAVALTAAEPEVAKPAGEETPPVKDEVMEEVLKEEEEAEIRQTRLCQICGNELVYVQKYDRWYCSKCRKYEKKAEKKAPGPSDKRKCPTCGKDATWILKYERWYCYLCKKYLPKEGEAPTTSIEAKPAVFTQPEIPPCPFCGKPATWIDKYERYYCYPCKKYVPKAAIKGEGIKIETAAVAAGEKKEESDAPTCPTCGKPTSWIEKYQRYYCYPCKKYLSKDAEKGSSKNSAEPPLCQACGKATTWVAKYERYYCYPCKKYAPKESK